jgi:hypothetical protein
VSRPVVSGLYYFIERKNKIMERKIGGENRKGEVGKERNN